MRLLAFALGALALGAATPPSWHTFRANGISVRYPPGWTATARNLTPVTSPQQVLAVGSYRFPTDVNGADGCEPKQALDRLPATGAFVFGWEYGQIADDHDFPPRPAHFGLAGYGRYECFGPSYLIRFRDTTGRAFQLQVAFGPHASAATRSAVLRVLDSFEAP